MLLFQIVIDRQKGAVRLLEVLCQFIQRLIPGKILLYITNFSEKPETTTLRMVIFGGKGFDFSEETHIIAKLEMKSQN